ncbi:MAG TPA: hypothetical protein VM307_01680 [Egibacteraceae bacterium]|nr:hypothetical protein [Egibacteraceae bacterium]
MRHRLLRLLAATLLTLSLGVAGAAAQDAEAGEATRLYLRNDGGGCPGFPFLSQVPGDGTDVNCGYIHGLPFGEIYRATEDEANKRSYVTQPAEGTYLLDGARDITGQLTIRNGRPDPAVPTRIGVGEVVADLTLRAVAVDGTAVDFGSVQVKGNATPGENSFAIPFTFDVDEALGAVELKELTLVTDVRGLHVYSGYTGANDTSWFDVPVIVGAEEPVQ